MTRLISPGGDVSMVKPSLALFPAPVVVMASVVAVVAVDAMHVVGAITKKIDYL